MLLLIISCLTLCDCIQDEPNPSCLRLDTVSESILFNVVKRNSSSPIDFNISNDCRYTARILDVKTRGIHQDEFLI